MNNDKQYSFRTRKILPIRVHDHQINFKANRQARMELSSQAFVLYNFFVTIYGDDYIISSRARICEETHLSPHFYYKSFNELVEHGYLRLIDSQNSMYDAEYDSYFCYEDPKVPYSATGRRIF